MKVTYISAPGEFTLHRRITRNSALFLAAFSILASAVATANVDLLVRYSEIVGLALVLGPLTLGVAGPAWHYYSLNTSRIELFGKTLRQMRNATRSAALQRKTRLHFWDAILGLACCAPVLIFISVYDPGNMIVNWWLTLTAAGFSPLLAGATMVTAATVAAWLSAVAALSTLRLVARFFYLLTSRNASDHYIQSDTYTFLFLRGFRSDMFRISTWGIPLTLMEGLMSSHLKHISRPVAIGSPADILPPIGARRHYVKQGDWQDVVGELVRNSEIIIFQVGDGAWLPWEFSKIIAAGQLSRCLIVFPPKIDDATVTCWRRILERVNDSPIHDSLAIIKPRATSAAFLLDKDELIVVLSTGRDSTAYTFALEVFLYCRFAAASSSK